MPCSALRSKLKRPSRQCRTPNMWPQKRGDFQTFSYTSENFPSGSIFFFVVELSMALEEFIIFYCDFSVFCIDPLKPQRTTMPRAPDFKTPPQGTSTAVRHRTFVDFDTHYLLRPVSSLVPSALSCPLQSGSQISTSPT